MGIKRCLDATAAAAVVRTLPAAAHFAPPAARRQPTKLLAAQAPLRQCPCLLLLPRRGRATAEQRVLHEWVAWTHACGVGGCSVRLAIKYEPKQRAGGRVGHRQRASSCIQVGQASSLEDTGSLSQAGSRGTSRVAGAVTVTPSHRVHAGQQNAKRRRSAARRRSSQHPHLGFAVCSGCQCRWRASTSSERCPDTWRQ